MRGRPISAHPGDGWWTTLSAEHAIDKALAVKTVRLMPPGR
jgi:hypothetical protein